MKLKNISITPKPLVLSEKARELFAKFKEANEADKEREQHTLDLLKGVI